MKNNISVSVIVPVFNTGKLLFPCVRSLLSQSLSNIEVIIVDDGSDRYTRRICEKIAAKFTNKIRLVQFTFNKRQGAARNAGIDLARGEYIGLVDSDDYVALDMYEKLYDKAKLEKADIVDCDLVRSRKNGQEKYEVSSRKDQIGFLDFKKRRSLILRGGRMVTKIVKKEIWTSNDITYPEGMAYEDNAIGSLHLMYAQKLAKVEEALYFYRYNQNSTTHNLERYLDRLPSAELFMEEYKKRGFYKEFREEIEWRFVQLYYLNSYRKIAKNFSKPTFMDFLSKVKELCPDYRQNQYFKKSVSHRKRLETYWLEKFPTVVRALLKI